MNYQKLYDAIIARAQVREKPDCYCEKHHIIPRSMGGGDEVENIAILTAKEHFIAHWLLYKIHRNRSMSHAFWKMTHAVGNGRSRYVSRSYMYAREAHSKAQSEFFSGENHPFYGKRGAETPGFGSRRTEASKQKIREKALTRKARGIRNGKRKRVINLNTGETFESAMDAQANAIRGNVVYAITNGGTANKQRYAYLDDNDQPIIISSKLKGYATGERVPSARAVVHVETGEIYQTLNAAGMAIGMTGEGIGNSIKRGRPTKKGTFQYV